MKREILRFFGELGRIGWKHPFVLGANERLLQRTAEMRGSPTGPEKIEAFLNEVGVGHLYGSANLQDVIASLEAKGHRVPPADYQTWR